MRLLAVAVALAVLLAGCSGPPGLERDEPTDGDDGGAGPRPGAGGGGGAGGDGTDLPRPERPERLAMLLSFGLEGCTGLESLVSLEPEAAQAVLPEGYTVATTDGPGGAVATARYVWVHCGGLRTPTAFVNDTVFGSVALHVEPPGDAADADEHWYRFRVMAQDDLLGSLWVAAGYDVAVGEYADSSQVAATPGAGTLPEDRDVRLGGYAGQGLALVPPSAPDAVRQAHYTETDGGRLEWVGTYTPSSARSLAGTLEVAADDPLWDVPTASGPPQEALSQRYLDAVAWTETDLWLRTPGTTGT